MSTYSFLNISLMMVGPGIAANLAAGAAIAEEGITLAPSVDKNEMQIGADGKGQHSLIADDSAHLIIRTLKTSPANALLMAAYDLQTSSSALHGKNVFTLTDSARGDASVLTQGAFKKKPELVYAGKAQLMEWAFDIITANTILGTG